MVKRQVMPDIFVAPKVEKKEPEEKTAPEVKKNSQEEGGPKAPQGGQKPTVNPLAAFAWYPPKTFFVNQHKGEEIIFLLRKHLITNVPWIFIFFLLLFTPAVFSFLNSRLNFFTLPLNFLLVATTFWYLFSSGYAFLNFILWYFNVSLVTSERIVDIDFPNLLYHEVSATKLSLVQDVTFKKGGFGRAIFHYGDVFVQTAGTEPNFDFLAIPNPEIVVKKIEELMGRNKGGV